MTEPNTIKSNPETKALSLKTTVFGFMLAGSMIPLGLYANFSYNHAKHQIVEHTSTTLRGVNQSNAQIVQTWIEGNEAAIRIAAIGSELSTMDPATVRDYTVKVNEELPVFYAIIATGKDGVQIARSNIDRLVNVSDRPYFKKAMAGAPSTLQAAISKITGKNFFTVAVPIRNASKEIVGVLSALTESSQITDKITSAKMGETGFSYLVNAEGMVLAHPDIRKVGTKVPEDLGSVLRAKRFGFISDWVSSENIDVKGTASSAGNGLVLVTQMTTEEVDFPLQAAQNSLIFFVLSALGLTGVLSWFLANSIASKINLLSSIAGRISKARTEADLIGMEKQIDSVGGAYEFRQMGASIKRLGNSIRLAMTSQTRALPD